MRLLNKLFPKPAPSASVDVTTIRDERSIIRIETRGGVLVRLYVNGRLYTGQMIADAKDSELVPAMGEGLQIRYGVLRGAVIT